MNYLELCVEVIERADGISGAGPVAVSGQVGIYAKVVKWVNLAWRDIQRHRPNWSWMFKAKTFSTTSGAAEYTPAAIPIADFGAWDKDKVFLTDNGENVPLAYVPYSEWYADYVMKTGAAGRPGVFSVGPGGSMVFGPTPDASYSVTAGYFTKACPLVADTDTPALQEAFHELIVLGALMYYGAYDNAAEVYSSAEKLYDDMLGQLTLRELPPITIAARPVA